MPPYVAEVKDRLEAGQRVSPKELGAELGCSHQHVTNALRAIAAEGLEVHRSEERVDGRAMCFYSLNGTSPEGPGEPEGREKKLTATQKLKDRMLAGEFLTAEAAAGYGAGRSLFYFAVKDLRAEGYSVKKKNVRASNGRSVNAYAVTARRSSNGSTPAVRQAKAEAWERKHGAFQMPALGTASIAATLSLGPDGTRRIDWRGVEGTWHCTVTGFTPGQPLSE